MFEAITEPVDVVGWFDDFLNVNFVNKGEVLLVVDDMRADVSPFDVSFLSDS